MEMDFSPWADGPPIEDECTPQDGQAYSDAVRQLQESSQRAINKETVKKWGACFKDKSCERCATRRTPCVWRQDTAGCEPCHISKLRCSKVERYASRVIAARLSLSEEISWARFQKWGKIRRPGSGRRSAVGSKPSLKTTKASRSSPSKTPEDSMDSKLALHPPGDHADSGKTLRFRKRPTTSPDLERHAKRARGRSERLSGTKAADAVERREEEEEEDEVFLTPLPSSRSPSIPATPSQPAGVDAGQRQPLTRLNHTSHQAISRVRPISPLANQHTDPEHPHRTPASPSLRVRSPVPETTISLPPLLTTKSAGRRAGSATTENAAHSLNASQTRDEASASTPAEAGTTRDLWRAQEGNDVASTSEASHTYSRTLATLRIRLEESESERMELLADVERTRRLIAQERVTLAEHINELSDFRHAYHVLLQGATEAGYALRAGSRYSANGSDSTHESRAQSVLQGAIIQAMDITLPYHRPRDHDSSTHRVPISSLRYALQGSSSYRSSVLPPPSSAGLASEHAKQRTTPLSAQKARIRDSNRAYSGTANPRGDSPHEDGDPTSISQDHQSYGQTPPAGLANVDLTSPEPCSTSLHPRMRRLVIPGRDDASLAGD